MTNDWADPVDVLDDEAWDAPGALTPGEWRVQGGHDGRCGPDPDRERDWDAGWAADDDDLNLWEDER